METRSIAHLRPHEENERIYGDHADADLVASVKTFGVLSPLLITADGRIISGHRRWEAAQKAGLTSVGVLVFESEDEYDILDALLESNRARHKTNEQTGKEEEVKLKVEADRARERQALLNNVSKGSLAETLPEARKGDARDKAAAYFGVSGKQLEKNVAVVQALRDLERAGKAREAGQLRTTLNKKSVNAAYKQASDAGLIRQSQPTQKPLAGATGTTLVAWKQLSAAEQRAVLGTPRKRDFRFREQETDGIEWAKWSWNPVEGCLHNCPFCYARDTAEEYYAHGFAPSFLPERLGAPDNSPLPLAAATDISYRNVFTCSMADLFGRWVPREWIEAVLDVVRRSPQWNFLFLTKFPNRLREFEFPANAWVGTTCEAQARIPVAERAMREVRAGVKWVSCEPMLERLTFSELGIFDWVVIGGASVSSKTPEYRPPREHVEHLEAQARAAGCLVFEKSNLLSRIREYPGQPAPAPINVAREFHIKYLERDLRHNAAYEREVVG